MVGIKGKSGGKRQGAGRPKAEQVKSIMSLRLEPDLLDYVSKKENKSKFINECIRKEMLSEEKLSTEKPEA